MAEENLGYYNPDYDAFEISEDRLTNKELFEFITQRDLAGMMSYFNSHTDLKPLIYKIENDEGNNLLAAAALSANKPMTSYLVTMERSFVSLTNALFICINKRQYELMMNILDRQESIKKGLGLKLKPGSHPPCISRIGVWKDACFEYPPFLTPLMFACQRNDFVAVYILIDYGHRLNQPHPPSCKCDKCRNLADITLVESLSRLHEFKALSSPAYISLTAIDPVIHTFRLYTDLLEEAEAEPEHMEEYRMLATGCSDYVTKMMGLCRTKDEVRIMLSRQAEFKTRYTAVPFIRIQQALELEFKLFVANGNCQQVLADKWYGNDWALRRMSSFGMFFCYLRRIVTLPFIVILYVIAPYGPTAERCRIPVNKFLNEAASLTLFLIFNLVMSNFLKNDDSRGPPWLPFFYINLWYVLAMWYIKVAYLVGYGSHSFFLNSWNLFDLVMLTFFSLSFICWGLAAYEIGEFPGSQKIPRSFWPAYEPRLVGEILYSLGIMLTFFRMFSFLQLSRVIGPLQICVFRMIVETIPFLCIMGVVWMAFTVTLYNLYHSYARMTVIMPDGTEEKSAHAYSSLGSSGSSVYWGFFGDAESLSPKVQLPPIYIKVGQNVTTVFHQHSLTQATGSVLFALFNLLGLVILMNMLVAIMSDSYSHIVVQSMNAWKFARTRVWLNYFYSGNSMPAPYNLLPTTKIFLKLWYFFSGNDKYGKYIFPMFSSENQLGDDNRVYEILITELVGRYVRTFYGEYIKGKKMRPPNRMRKAVA